MTTEDYKQAATKLKDFGNFMTAFRVNNHIGTEQDYADIYWEKLFNMVEMAIWRGEYSK